IPVPDGDGWQNIVFLVKADGHVDYFYNGQHVYTSADVIAEEYSGSAAIHLGSRRSFYDNVTARFSPACTDADGDGYFAETEGCGPVDCNDSDFLVNPGMYEVPGDFIDDNCDGNIGECDPCMDWKSHGKYVRCVAQEVEALVQQGLISEEDGDVLVSSGAQTEIGKKDYIDPLCQ
ncbi:MAG: putative metal-binding motif-containing protein, partial [Saprospiraceae bacterium]|nr:putative metal-binding motif-containing protein [Saprospiraceae bacterium]